MLSKVSQMQKVKNHMISLMWDPDNSMAGTRRMGDGGAVKGKGAHICGDRIRLDFGW